MTMAARPTPDSSVLRLQVERLPSDTRSIVKWGGKEFRMEVIQISPQGDEAVVPLTDQELRALITKVEQTLAKLQRANLDPSQLRQVDLLWRGKLENNKIVAYTYTETTYMRNQEQVRQKVPLNITGDIEGTYPELKSLNDFFSRRLASS